MILTALKLGHRTNAGPRLYCRAALTFAVINCVYAVCDIFAAVKVDISTHYFLTKNASLGQQS